MGSGGNQEAVKPTPGPWVVHGRNSPREPIVVGHDEIGPRRTLAKVYQPAGTKDAEANARLIAAAPCMANYVAKRAAEGDADAVQLMERINGHV